MTTVNVPPDDIHEIGLKEVARITGEMTRWPRARDTRTWPASGGVNNDPSGSRPASNRFWMTTKIHPSDGAEAPELFGFVLPSRQSPWNRSLTSPKAAATHYVQGTPDGKRPGRVVVAVSNPSKAYPHRRRSRAYHEGVPGHHLQSVSPRRWKACRSFGCTVFYTAYARRFGHSTPRC